MPVYRLLSPIAGALYLLVLLALIRQPLLAPGWLPYALFATLGLMQLFFGYVENYSFAAAGVLACPWLGLAMIEARRPLWLPATLLLAMLWPRALRGRALRGAPPSRCFCCKAGTRWRGFTKTRCRGSGRIDRSSIR